MRPGRRFRMILHAEQRERTVTEPFVGAIVQIDVRDLNIGSVQRIWIDREAMILRRNLNRIRPQILYGVVSAAVSELQLIRLPSQRVSEQLVTQTNPKYRFLAEQVLNRIDRIPNRRRIAGTVGKKNAIGIHLQHFIGGKIGWHNGQAASVGGKPSEDI